MSDDSIFGDMFYLTGELLSGLLMASVFVVLVCLDGVCSLFPDDK